MVADDESASGEVIPSVDIPADGSDASSHGRHLRSRRPIARITGLVTVGALWSGALLAGWSFHATAAASDGEPPEVVVATWMRDNHTGWAVAGLENLYYRFVVTPEVGGDPEISADIADEDEAGLDEASGGPTSGASASATAASSPSASAVSAPSPTPTKPSPAPTHLDPPPPIISPIAVPEPKEGEWQPVGSRVDGEPAIYVTRVRADAVHTKYYASVMWIDTSLAKGMFVPGYEEPGGPNPFNGALPEELWPSVLANMNGAFRLGDSMGGYAYDGEVVRPLVDGLGTTVVFRDGSVRIGKWGRDFAGLTDDMMAVRQNLRLIVDKGESKVSSATDNVVWGATTDKESLAWRAAIGQRTDGSIIYVGSPFLSAEGLANTLVGAGVDEAMVLDMNNWWTAGFYFRHKADGTPLCRKLDPSILEDCDRFLKQYKRDSFQFLARGAVTR